LNAVGQKDPRYKEFDRLYGPNIIVFPSTGDMPQQKMMAGGDLDGDTYHVFWDKELVNSISEK